MTNHFMSWPTTRAVLLLLMPLSATSRTLNTRAQRETPATVAQSLLDADARYASSSADMLTSLRAMLSPSVVMPGGPAGLIVGREAVLAIIKSQPDVSTASGVAHATWRAIRAGVSADGQHGFTFGFFTLTKADGTTVPSKYMAYWIRERGAWQVVAYKRGRSAGVASDTSRMAPAVPRAMTAVNKDRAVVTRLRHELMQREGEFSAAAQRTGLGNAFVEFGSADAVNMGGASLSSYVVGADAIAALVAGGDMKASPVHWSADTAFVASSGDLGITFGLIRANAPPAGANPNAGSPFFTIWRRADIRSPWRYVAE